MIKIPSLKELLEVGVHFGHRTSRWQPKMKPFIFGASKGVHIINLEETRKYLTQAAEFVLNLTRRGGVILFVGTKDQARKPIEEAAKRCGMPYVTGRWMGGLFTNFNTVLGSLKKLARLEEDQEKGRFEKYTKKERLEVQREIDRLHESIGGIKEIRRLPEAVFIADVNTDKIATQETKRKQIPIVATLDSNSSPVDIDYPIPANDDAVKAIALIANVLADAVLEGKKIAAEQPAAKAVPIKKEPSKKIALKK